MGHSMNPYTAPPSLTFTPRIMGHSMSPYTAPPSLTFTPRIMGHSMSPYTARSLALTLHTLWDTAWAHTPRAPSHWLSTHYGILHEPTHRTLPHWRTSPFANTMAMPTSGTYMTTDTATLMFPPAQPNGPCRPPTILLPPACAFTIYTPAHAPTFCNALATSMPQHRYHQHLFWKPCLTLERQHSIIWFHGLMLFMAFCQTVPVKRLILFRSACEQGLQTQPISVFTWRSKVHRDARTTFLQLWWTIDGTMSPIQNLSDQVANLNVNALLQASVCTLLLRSEPSKRSSSSYFLHREDLAPGLTASVWNEITMPHALATIMHFICHVFVCYRSWKWYS